MKNKDIKRFRDEDYGLFIDTEDQDASIGIDPMSGDILLNEGYGECHYNGAAISQKSFNYFNLENLGRNKYAVILYFGKNKKHVLGVTEDREAANKWIEKATSIIRIEDITVTYVNNKEYSSEDLLILNVINTN